MFDALDEKYMARALELAAMGLGKTAPNPAVGAVVVRDGVPVGEGWHQRCGGPHAEVFALLRAGQNARNATAYVSLEPCSHYGKTPPCARALIEAGVTRVVVAMQDPNPKVRGRGIRLLREQGIRVDVGLMKKEAAALNEDFIHWVTTGKPFVALKLAQTLDGKIAARFGEETPITGNQSRKIVHSLRNRYAAVMVGIGTVLADDPLLTVRGIRDAGQPVRLVLDSGLRLPESSQLVKTAKDFPLVVFYRSRLAEKARIERLESLGVKLVPVRRGPREGLDLVQVLEEIAKMNLTSVMLEGGRASATGFLRQRLVQRLHLFTAPMILGEAKAIQGIGPLPGTRIKLVDTVRSFTGEDIYLTGRLDYL